MELRDALLKDTKALPNGAATVYSDGIDTGKSANGKQLAECEFLLTAPALTTTEQPDAKTTIYSILVDTVAPIDGSSTVLIANCITQTGAGGAGAAAQTYRFRLPTTAAKLVGFKAVGSTTGNNSAKSATLEALF